MDNQLNPQNPQAFVKRISIIHLAMFMGQVLFAIVVLITNKRTGAIYSKTDVFTLVVPIFAAANITVSIVVFKNLVRAAAGKYALSDKLLAYQTAVIVRCALTESVTLFAIVVYYITGELLFIIIAAALILYFLSFRPTKEKISDDLNLSYEDKILFDSSDPLS